MVTELLSLEILHLRTVRPLHEIVSIDVFDVLFPKTHFVVLVTLISMTLKASIANPRSTARITPLTNVTNAFDDFNASTCSPSVLDDRAI
jgi:hypothetical protein